MHKVLLVDDEPSVIEGLTIMIEWEKLGFEICGACKNGEEAARLMESLSPDLVITDIRMPGMDGLSLIEYAANNIDRSMKFIIISGHKEFEYARKAMQYGVNHYILKPIFSEEVTEALLEIDKQLKEQAKLKEFHEISDDVISNCNREAMNYKFFSDIEDKIPSYGLENIRYIDVILEAIENQDINKVNEAINAAFLDFQEKLLAPKIIKMLVINIIYRSINAVKEMKGDPEVLLKKYNILGLENGKFTMEELKKLLRSYCEECIYCLNTLRDRESNSNIYAIEEYIKNNFRNSITIKDMAQKLYINPVYLGQVFLKRFGMSLNEYLHKLRIEEAKVLIEETDMMTHQIAEKVGYRNYNNFFSRFEKHVGLTPTEYKKEFLKKHTNI